MEKHIAICIFRINNLSNILNKKGSDYVGKVLVLAFDDNEETMLKGILKELTVKGHLKPVKLMETEKKLQYENFLLEPGHRQVKVNNKYVVLTHYEFEILYLLARHPGQVFSKEQIYCRVWDSPYHGAEDNVMSLIRRIRKKIELDPRNPKYILTVWGTGYKFNSDLKK